MITTEPVIYLDLFKAAVVFGTAIGLFTIDDARLATITTALGVLLTAGLTFLNRNSVYSQQTHDRQLSIAIGNSTLKENPTIVKNPPSITP